MAEANVKISVEKVAHDSVKKLIQSIMDEHKLRIDDISINWRSIGGSSKILNIQIISNTV